MQSWFIYSLLAAAFLAVNFLFVKKAGLMSIPVETLSFYAWLIATLGVAALMLVERKAFALTAPQLGVALATGGAFLFGTLALYKGAYLAPNPGFATAVGSVQVILVVIAAAYLFGSPMTFLKVCGVVLVIAGVVLLGQ